MRHGDATRDLLGVRAVGVARKGGLLDSLNRVLTGASDGAARTFAAAYLEHHVFDLGVKVELHAVRLEIALHGQNHRLVLVVAGEAQGAKVGQTRDVVDVAADIELHLERRVPVLKGEHGAPVHPEVRVEHLVVKEIGDGTIRQLLVGRKEQVHDLGCRLVRQAELAIGAAVLATVLSRATQRVVGVLLVEPVILVEYGDVRIFNRGNGAKEIPHDLKMIVHLAAAAHDIAHAGDVSAIAGAARNGVLFEDMDVASGHLRIAHQVASCGKRAQTGADNVGALVVDARRLLGMSKGFVVSA